VRLAVANVVRNALDHARFADGSPPGVRVAVSAATVIVDDDGPGIAVDDRDRVLRRFERGGHSSGSGLGLAIARQIAVAHGGEVVISESPTGGARIEMRFGR
jgi:signal transduction histidine kinase